MLRDASYYLSPCRRRIAIVNEKAGRVLIGEEGSPADLVRVVRTWTRLPSGAVPAQEAPTDAPASRPDSRLRLG